MPLRTAASMPWRIASAGDSANATGATLARTARAVAKAALRFPAMSTHNTKSSAASPRAAGMSMAAVRVDSSVERCCLMFASRTHRWTADRRVRWPVCTTRTLIRPSRLREPA